MANTGSSRNVKVVRAPPQRVYGAFLDPRALAVWLAPDGMTGRVHEFDGRVGGGYVMSLFYPPTEEGSPGKTAEREDRFRARFVELSPPERIAQAVNFDADDPAFAGEMSMVVTLTAVEGGTEITMEFRDIPSGIPPEANEEGTRQSLEKLARYLEAEGREEAGGWRRGRGPYPRST